MWGPHIEMCRRPRANPKKRMKVLTLPPFNLLVRSTRWVACVTAVAASGIAAHAATDTWTPTTGGSYDWNSNGNWLSGTQFPNGIDDTANLNIDISGNQTISLNQAITLGTLNLGDLNSSAAFTINLGTSGGLIFDVSSGFALLDRTSVISRTDVINADVTLNDNLVVRTQWSGSGNGLQINGLITGTGGINLTANALPASGTSSNVQFLDLTNTANSFTGDTIISNGRLSFRGDVLVSTDGALGNSANAVILTSPDSLTPTSSQSFSNAVTTELRLIASDDSTNYTFARGIDFSTGAGDLHAGRTRFTLGGDGSGGLNTNTLIISGDVTLGSSSRRVEFYTERAGQTMYFTGNITTPAGANGTIYWGPGANGTPTADGRTNGTYRFSDVARAYTNGQNLTNGTAIIEGSVGAFGTASPIGTQGFSLGDGSGGNLVTPNSEGANRSVFLADPGSSYARTFFPGGGSGSNFATTSAPRQALYGNSGSLNALNGYSFGGLNTSGTTTFSANITPGNVNVPVTGTAAGAGGTNVIQVAHNIALIAATGGTTEFTGNISGSTAIVPGSATPGAMQAASSTRVTINQFRNHPNLDSNFDGIADANANQLVGTATNGTVVFKGTNSYSESTELLGGTLRLDYGTNNTTKLSDTAALIFNGGNLELAGGSHTEIVGSTTLSGISSITRSSGSAVLQMGAITRNLGAILRIGAENIAGTDTLNDATGILGSWATIGSDWAANSTNAPGGLIVAYTGYTDVTRLSSGSKVIADNALNNVRVAEGTGTEGDITLGAATTTINTLKMEANGGPALINPGTTETLNIVTGGILLQAGSGALTIGTTGNDGTLTAGGPVNTAGTLDIANRSSNPFTINSVIADNGTGVVGLGFVGPGTTILTGDNTYTGQTVLGEGRLQIGDGGTTGSLSTAALVNDGTLIFNRSDSLTQGVHFSNVISGTGSVVHDGSGTLTLNGGNAYMGKTVINSGTLSIADETAIGSAPTVFAADHLTLNSATLATTASLSLNDPTRGITLSGTGGTFDIADGTTTTIGFDNTITGSGGLTKVNAGMLLISGPSTYIGVTTINEGILQINDSAALGSTTGNTIINSTGSITSSVGTLGGQLRLNGSLTVAENITIIGTGDATNFQRAISAQNGDSAITGVITMDSNRTYRIGASNGTLTLGLIERTAGNSARVVFDPSGAGSGTVIVSQAMQTNGGAVTVHGGGLLILNAANNDIGDTHVQNSSTLRIGADDALSTTGTLRIGQNTGSTSTSTGGAIGTFDLNGFNQTINDLEASRGATTQPGTSRLITNSAPSTTSTLTVGNGNRSDTFDGVIEDGAGTLAFTKVGTGTQTLTGANTYTGSTIVSGGTLALSGDGSFADSSHIRIDSGATLDVAATTTRWELGSGQTLSGTGTVLGGATILGTHTPGTSPGLQTFDSDLAYSGGSSSLVWELTANTGSLGDRGTFFDGINVGGNLEFLGSTTVTLAFNTAGSTVDWSDALWGADQEWLLFDVAGATTGFGNLGLFIENWADKDGDLFNSAFFASSFGLTQNGNDVFLTYTYAIPEPSRTLLLFLGTLMIGLRRRR